MPLLEHDPFKNKTHPYNVGCVRIYWVSSKSAANGVFHQTHFYVSRAHLPEALRQQLLAYEREKERDREKDKEKDEKRERGGHSYPSILEQQILTLDREMLDKLSATYNEAEEGEGS
uniref:Uncharacterized protein n=1 Tax=Anabas testudineus TaxID=64144 RepID=A0A7N6B9L3_ANATE